MAKRSTQELTPLGSLSFAVLTSPILPSCNAIANYDAKLVGQVQQHSLNVLDDDFEIPEPKILVAGWVLEVCEVFFSISLSNQIYFRLLNDL